MSLAGDESIWAAAKALAEKIQDDPRFETDKVVSCVQGLLQEVMTYALHSEEVAMMRGDAAAAMAYLEVGISAREQIFAASHGLFGFSPLSYIDPYPLEDAAAVGRTDLIDRAIALELSNDDADKDNGGHYDGRIAVQKRIRESVPWLASIRAAAEREPGIRQVDLQEHCPGADNRTISRLVDQLAAVGILATEKVGSRVHVWPAEHADAPTGDRLRQTAKAAERELVQSEGTPAWQLEPEQALAWAQQVLSLMQADLDNPERGTTLVPQPSDLPGLWVVAADSEGRLCVYQEDPDEMVVWGHVDEAMMKRILGSCWQLAEIPSRRKQKWLGAQVRHTHLVREKRTDAYRAITEFWGLREVREETQWSVPVTVLNSPHKFPAGRAGMDQIVWLS